MSQICILTYEQYYLGITMFLKTDLLGMYLTIGMAMKTERGGNRT